MLWGMGWVGDATLLEVLSRTHLGYYMHISRLLNT